MTRALLLLVVLILNVTPTLNAQKRPNRKAAKPAVVKQGICGTVIEKRGNQMPGPGISLPAAAPLSREVLIFPLLNASQVEMGESGFINSVGDAKPVKTVKSDKRGRFCVSLPVGRYTVMVREPKGFYANLSDSQNNIFPVNVQKNRQSTVTVEITHGAVF